MQGGKGKKQMWIRSLFLIFYGLCAGGLIAASFLAFLSMLGVIPRLAGLTKSMKNARMYESFVALEGFLGHWYLFIDGRSKLDTRFLYCMDCLEESLWDV